MLKVSTPPFATDAQRRVIARMILSIVRILKAQGATPKSVGFLIGFRRVSRRECRVSIGEESCRENQMCPERVNATSAVLASILDSGWTPKRHG